MPVVQHDDSGALEVLDKVRWRLGLSPTNCEPCVLISEEFAGEDEGLWQYQLIVQTSTWQVEQRDLQNSHKFTTALLRRADSTLRRKIWLFTTELETKRETGGSVPVQNR
ncbi:hypothetical bacteriophage protein [Avibacterium paragallinarum]|uniref:Hypothetical bacteriophage protein n=1 Tax=Avibacterium paragallinarum TaxID=728 RepID=A0A377I722_AVIPA|nr:hypothetical bacteriophage protein [Avibacterium paragallinarum]